MTNKRAGVANEYVIDGDAAKLILTDRSGTPVASAIIDVEDLDRVLAQGRWCCVRLGRGREFHYARSTSGPLLHRFLLTAKPDEIVDHVNGDGLDCRKANIRICSHANNMKNRHGAQKNSSTGIRGVIPVKGHPNRWRVRVRADCRAYHIGYFDTLAEAQVAAVEARRRLHGAFASDLT